MKSAKIQFVALSSVVLATASIAHRANADLTFDQDVTPDVIFGSGNANGSFTVDRVTIGDDDRGDDSGFTIELGLRGKLRFGDDNLPANTFNSNGDGTYTFNAGTPDLGGSNLPDWAVSTTPIWNFEWSVNVDAEDTEGGSSSHTLDDFTYMIGIDFDPTSGTDFFLFDFISDPGGTSFFDHAMGDNDTGNGGGTVATDNASYVSLLDDQNVAQNSWNYESFNFGPYAGFDPNAPGEYTIFIAIFGEDDDRSDDENELARTEITIIVVPTPGALALMGMAGIIGRRRRRR